MLNFKFWWGLNIFWVIVFASVFVFIMNKQIVLSGPVRVYQMRMVALAILLYFSGIIGVGQVLFYHYIKSKMNMDKLEGKDK
ncbi:DUF3923 family protein [Companilactobacillus ginsenosidimutans]|uniref:NADH:ubiquinone oxidoreductase n=1 Tax=Companilactobacillus ginsenosidimutans TaxID=1007676 RepID=A0A0H4QHA8_9LACO|nr:DUF3923 family protein [Companilactobacillus ginsenosidimutans]AKP67342.1 hypothetical protein ABM34_07175 [Companilactobacillus ginsenosidimutans]